MIESYIKLGVLILCTGLVVVWFIYAFLITFNSAPFLPSFNKHVKKALAQVKFDKNTNFIDIGSGDGRVVMKAAKLGAGKVTGVEINPFLSLLSRLVLAVNRVPNAHIIQADMFKLDLSQYNMIYTYLLPDTMNKLLPIIKSQVKPGTIVISNTFKFTAMTPAQTVDNIYIYQF